MDAFYRCLKKKGKITIEKTGPKEWRRVCKCKGWGAVAEDVIYSKTDPKKKKRKKK